MAFGLGMMLGEANAEMLLTNLKLKKDSVVKSQNFYIKVTK